VAITFYWATYNVMLITGN